MGWWCSQWEAQGLSPGEVPGGCLFTSYSLSSPSPEAVGNKPTLQPLHPSMGEAHSQVWARTLLLRLLTMGSCWLPRPSRLPIPTVQEGGTWIGNRMETGTLNHHLLLPSASIQGFLEITFLGICLLLFISRNFDGFWCTNNLREMNRKSPSRDVIMLT